MSYLPVPYAAPLAASRVFRILSCLISFFSSARISLPKFCVDMVWWITILNETAGFYYSDLPSTRPSRRLCQC